MAAEVKPSIHGLTIRPAICSDWADIENSQWADNCPMDKHVSKLLGSTSVVVVRQEDSFVGYGMYWFDRDSLDLFWVYVDPFYRRLKVGTSMVGILIQQFAADYKGQRFQVRGIVSDENKRAWQFCKHLEFEPHASYVSYSGEVYCEFRKELINDTCKGV